MFTDLRVQVYSRVPPMGRGSVKKNDKGDENVTFYSANIATRSITLKAELLVFGIVFYKCAYICSIK